MPNDYQIPLITERPDGTPGTLKTDVNGSLRASASNITTKYRESFEVYAPNTPGSDWVQVLANGDIARAEGNALACSYLTISKSPLFAGTETVIENANRFEMPLEVSIGAHLSQRTLGQEFAIELVSLDFLPVQPDITIASISQALSVLTVVTTTAHDLVPGKRIGITGCSNPLANYPALVVATIPTPTSFTATAGPGGNIPSQTITDPAGAKGFVYFRPALGYAKDGTSIIFENATATNASAYIRSDAGDSLPSGTAAGNHSATILTTASLQALNSAGTYAFQPTNEYRLALMADRVQWASTPVDSTAALTAFVNRTQVVPNNSKPYKFRLRAANNKALTAPSAQIVSAVKSGTTTATITTATDHGLVTGDVVVQYGIRDQAAASFPNITTATAVTVTGANTYTIIVGTASTVTSYGGYVAKIQGGNLMSALGALTMAAQSATIASGILTLVGSAAWAGVLNGDFVELVGLRDAATGASLGIDGAWRVRDIATTNLFLEYVGGGTVPSTLTTTNCGGGVIKRTDLRISFLRVFDFERERVEVMARPTGDIANSVGVSVNNSPAVAQSGAWTVGLSAAQTLGTVTTVGAVTSSNQGIPGTIADVASAALTSTATTAAFTPTFGCSYEVNIPVTAATGTNPTLDVTIEESDDGGTNWFRVYDIPRITATGIYRSPKLPLTGNRVRYVQTVGGTTPSFTRAINRLQCSDMADPVRQNVDRSVVLTTLNSATPSLNVQNCRNAQLVVNIGAATTPPALQIEGSDDNGATWYALGSPLTAVASSTVRATVNDVQAQLLRARVSTAGSAVTAGYVTVKGF
jgi:hypothetical protein